MNSRFNPSDGPENKPPHARHGALEGLRVLVAEDTEMVRDLITILLAREKVSVTAVANGIAAIAAAQSEAFDIILMDMNMPMMGGFEATRRIRQSNGPCAGVPIVALTANVTKAEIAQCRRAGMDGHIAKPFNTNALTEAIGKVLFGA